MARDAAHKLLLLCSFELSMVTENEQTVLYKNVLVGFKGGGIRIMVEEMAIVKSSGFLMSSVLERAVCYERYWIGGKQRRKNRRVCVLWCVEPNRTIGLGVCVRESPNDLHTKNKVRVGTDDGDVWERASEFVSRFHVEHEMGEMVEKKKPKIPFCCSQKLHLLEPKTWIFQKIFRSRKIGWSMFEV